MEGGTEAGSERLSYLPSITQLVIDGVEPIFQLQSLVYKITSVLYSTNDHTELLDNNIHIFNISIFLTTPTKETPLCVQ